MKSIINDLVKEYMREYNKDPNSNVEKILTGALIELQTHMSMPAVEDEESESDLISKIQNLFGDKEPDLDFDALADDNYYVLEENSAGPQPVFVLISKFGGNIVFTCSHPAVGIDSWSMRDADISQLDENTDSLYYIDSESALEFLNLNDKYRRIRK